jgi:hypothetical protein
MSWEIFLSCDCAEYTVTGITLGRQGGIELAYPSPEPWGQTGRAPVTWPEFQLLPLPSPQFPDLLV